jgi:hypothetical protein
MKDQSGPILSSRRLARLRAAAGQGPFALSPGHAARQLPLGAELLSSRRRTAGLSGGWPGAGSHCDPHPRLAAITGTNHMASACVAPPITMPHAAPAAPYGGTRIRQGIN